MKAKEFAEKINGREYPFYLTKDEQAEAKDSGLFVIYGNSDDLLEIRGLDDDEIGAYDGTTAFLNVDGFLEKPDCDCEWAEKYFEEAKKNSLEVRAQWCPEEYPNTSWAIHIDAPHETFHVMEDGDINCIGIVVDVKDVQDIINVRNSD